MKNAISNDVPKISVIIPAFNAEKNILKCVRSVLNQTFPEFELIIVDDGSTDATGSICKELQTFDDRVQYVWKINEGQGKARNLAIKMARGKWLVFVDSDDWINHCYLENLYTQAEKTDSDISVCDFIECDELNNCEIKRTQEIKEECLFNIEPSFWAKIWKKSLFEERNAEQPSFFFEDIAIVPFLFARASKITHAIGSEYYYLKQEGSTTKRIDTLNDRIQALEYLVELFKENHIFDQNKIELKNFVVQRCQADMVATKAILEKKFDQIYMDHDTLLVKHFQSNMTLLKARSEFVWGSYNTYRVAKYINRIEITYRFMASSIISAVSPILNKINQRRLERKKLLREENVIRDCTKKFMHMNPSELKDVEIILIDFLDERFSIAGEEGRFITLSDAYLEDAEAYIPAKIIKLWERKELWYVACDKFIDQLQNCFADKKIFLIRMKLAECYGDQAKRIVYEEIEDIKRVNNILDAYYNYFCDRCRNVIEIHVQDKADYYTDSEFRHGCYPWHLNEGVYQSIAHDIMKYLPNN